MHLSRQRRRAGFTLIELLVVIAIISLLAGMMMPAVQKVREAANRASCQNNLKQIGLAMRHYEIDHKTLPPGRYSSQGASWAVLIFPYMEEQTLFRTWDLNRRYYDQQDIARLTALPNYFCPTRRKPNTAPGASISGDVPCNGPQDVPNTPGALSDYAACVGSSGMFS